MTLSSVDRKSTAQRKKGILQRVSMEPSSHLSEKRDQLSPTAETPAAPLSPHLKNVYPTMRHIILVVSIILAITIIVFLIHQNGKSIYEHGI